MGKLVITYGLPGSGKTTWTNSQDKRGTLKIDVDKEVKESHRSGSEKERFLNFLKHYLTYRHDTIILDGLFFCNDDIISIIHNIDLDYLQNGELEIQYWKEDREACEWNDQYRREQDCISSIRNMQLEEPDIDRVYNELDNLKINCEVNIVNHLVGKKTKVQMFIDKFDLKSSVKNNEFRSSSWITGGEWWSYTGAEGDIDPEEPLSTFEEFDNLLLKINSRISFIQYKTIYNKCVSIKTNTKRDYYSNTNIAYYVCDIEELVNALEENEIEIFD